MLASGKEDLAFPCKITEVSISDTGKHGRAKARIVGIDILTGKKHDGLFNTKSDVDVPVVHNENLLVVDVEDDESNGKYLIVHALNEKTNDMEYIQVAKETSVADEVIKKHAKGQGAGTFVLCCMCMGYGKTTVRVPAGVRHA